MDLNKMPMPPLCIFCNKDREYHLWRSSIVIYAKQHYIGILTVCPQCREKHTVQEMYDALLKNMQKRTEEELKKLRHLTVKKN